MSDKTPLTPEEVAAVEAEHRVDPTPAPADGQASPTASVPRMDAPAPAVVDEFDKLAGHEVMVVKGDHIGQRAAVMKVYAVKGVAREALIRFKSTLYSRSYAHVPYDALKPAEHQGHQ